MIAKMDSSARAGFVLNLADDPAPLPVAFLGLGDGLDDLAPFAARPFAERLTRAPDEDES